MPTARNLIASAFVDCGLRSQIDQVTAEDTQQGLQKLNILIDILRVDKLWASGESSNEFSTTGGRWEYTILNKIVGIGPPDFLTTSEVIKVDSVQVLIGTAWSPITQVSSTDFYRLTQNIGAQTLPNVFALNRTRDPYDKILLQSPSQGSWKIRINYNGNVSNYELDDEINLPSGMFGCLEYGTSMLLNKAKGFEDTNGVGEIYKAMRERLISTNQPSPMLASSGGTKIWSIGADTHLYSRGY